MCLRQTVVLLRRDRKIPISALTQSIAESADHCGECDWAFRKREYKLQFPTISHPLQYHFSTKISCDLSAPKTGPYYRFLLNFRLNGNGTNATFTVTLFLFEKENNSYSSRQYPWVWVEFSSRLLGHQKMIIIPIKLKSHWNFCWPKLKTMNRIGLKIWIHLNA